MVRERRVAGLAALAVAALVAVGMVAVLSRAGSTGTAGATTPSPDLPYATVSTPDAEPIRLPLPGAEDGGQVRVVENGLAPYRERQSHRVTWGLILENTSQRTAAVVGVEVDIVDADGRSMLSNGPLSQWIVAMPGQRAGLGEFPYVTGPDAADLVATLEPEWWPPGNDPRPVATVDVSDVEPSREDAGRRSSDPLTLRFRVDSGYDSMLEDPYVYAIFRNRDGEIVGGYGDRFFTRIPPGWSVQQMRVHDGLPEQVDVGRTEIYLGG